MPPGSRWKYTTRPQLSSSRLAPQMPQARLAVSEAHAWVTSVIGASAGNETQCTRLSYRLEMATNAYIRGCQMKSSPFGRREHCLRVAADHANPMGSICTRTLCSISAQNLKMLFIHLYAYVPLRDRRTR